MKCKTLFAIFLFFSSAYLVTFRGHYGSDQFMSYLTAESLVLDNSLAIGVREFNLPDIKAVSITRQLEWMDSAIHCLVWRCL